RCLRMMTVPPSITCCKRASGSGAPFLKTIWILCRRQWLISISPRHSIGSAASRSTTTFPWSDRMSQSDRKTILIVDDTTTNIVIISSVLKDSFRTKVATNGEKALVLASAGDRPDLILLDITMPGMDGYEVCRRLKANRATHGIPVIFLTAKTEADDEKQGFEVGAVDYIHKPFSAPIVLARVNTHLALQAALQQAHEAQKQADELLRCLLPDAAAEEIRNIGTVIPRRYDSVAVL